MKTPFNLSAARAAGKAVCRDGSVATIEVVREFPDEVFPIRGTITVDGHRHLAKWTLEGKWLANMKEHPLDLVGLPDTEETVAQFAAGLAAIGQERQRIATGDQPRAGAVGPSVEAEINANLPALDQVRRVMAEDALTDSRDVELTRLRAEMARLEQVAIDQRDCIGRLRAENAVLKDALDLMRDEFMRISGLALNEYYAKGVEIAGICQRAISGIERSVPVLLELEQTTATLAHSRARVRELEEALTSVMETVSCCTDDGRWSDDCCAAMDKARALLEGGKV